MNPLGIEAIMAFDDENPEIIRSERAGLRLATSLGHVVGSYHGLLTKIAALHYHNPRFKMLFRGQSRDYKSIVGSNETPHSNLFPSLFRGQRDEGKRQLLKRGFDILQQAEASLTERLHDQDVLRHQIVRWAILQHYEVCPTPLLDVTTSLQTALSFAAPPGADSGFLYVLAVPQITGPISTSLESLTQVIDLQQLCPPQALRPHFQSGVLIGDYPIITRMEMTHGKTALIGNNFSCRLLSKFHLQGLPSWTAEGFRPTATSVLFPNDKDTWFDVTQEIRAATKHSP